MKRKRTGLSPERSLTKLLRMKRIVLFLMCFISVLAVTSINTFAQQPQKTLTGNVTDASGQPLVGVTILVKGTTTGTVTDVNGNFTLSVPADAQTLVFSFIGMTTQELPIGSQTRFTLSLREAEIGLGEVIVVGYGSQKKESVVGAIVQTTSEALQKTGATTNLARALQGQMAGVTTIQISGEPGREDPRILIRAQGTWNNSSPLILIDGIERSISDLDISEVETISVLKDASATAVFGVKGAEGVILVTTKRGKIGKPKLTINANTSGKFLSKTPDKMNSYDALQFRNETIEYENPVRADSWGYYIPQKILERWKQPQDPADIYLFPDVDWPSTQLKDFASSSKIDLSVSGGTDFAKYFGAISFTHEGDLLNSGLENNKGYKSQIAYDRFNFRTNLDFNVTESTIFSVNLSGYVGTKWGQSADQNIWRPFYQSAPNMYPARWPDGSWGYMPFTQIPNPLYLLNVSGKPKNVRTQVMTDFVLRQKLDFITEGLSVQGSLSYDNRFYTSGGISDGGGAPQLYIDYKIIDKLPTETDMDYTYGSIKTTGINDFDYVMQPASWNSENSTSLGSAYRRLYHQLALNYARVFDKHDVGALALWSREQFAEGSMFPRYREDWVGRLTYNYDQRYLFETNAAYNGSEKFASEYRFGFFPSVAVGWIISNESFLKKDWLNKLKVRFSVGKVGNDSFSAPRWAYQDVWSAGDNVFFGGSRPSTGSGLSNPYLQYYQSAVGNPNLQWETSVKQNLGFEVAVINNMFNLNVEIYKDHRSDIFMSAGQRQVPNYFGATAVAANLGETEAQGYEIEFKFQNTSSKQLYYWFQWSYSHAKDKVIFREDPLLLPDYKKAAGKAIGQQFNIFESFDYPYLNNWDEIYASLPLASGNTGKLPGELNIVDFNGDGTMDSYDSAPYSYPNRPMNTYSFSLGMDFKGFSASCQFYGVYNISRFMGWFLFPFSDGWKSVAMEYQRDSWRPWNTTPKWPAMRLQSTGAEGTRYTADGSYLRLKSAELAYTLSGDWIKKIGASSTRIYLNGNNLIFWSKMVDDRETDSVTNGADYPMFRTITLGLSVNF